MLHPLLLQELSQTWLCHRRELCGWMPGSQLQFLSSSLQTMWDKLTSVAPVTTRLKFKLASQAPQGPQASKTLP